MKRLNDKKPVLLIISCFLMSLVCVSCTKHSDKQIIQKKQENGIQENGIVEKRADSLQLHNTVNDSSHIRNSSDTSEMSEADDGIEFVYKIMPQQSGKNSVVSRSKGRIDFSLFYYRIATRGGFTYSFKKKNDSLIVYHFYEPKGLMKHCVDFHVQGHIANITAGTYTFKLNISYRNYPDDEWTLFTQPIVVK